MNHNSKLLSLLGLAKKAGKITLGHDTALESLRKRQSALIVLASDASARLEQEVMREKDFAKSEAKIIRIDHSMEDIGKALPKKAGIISVNDAAFAAGIQQILKEG